ncbi:MAG: glycosyltransferase [Gammaproteobacteria bacterium]|nr:glycosyltransferase [Gammaproteobacteria bacterium]
MQIFVLGMHRSGTSAVARILNLMGVYFGGEHVGTGRSEQNVKGFWERRDVRDLNDDMLFDSSCDWDCVADFDLDALSAETRSTHVDAAADIVLNMDAHRPWFIKEPRLCLLFPIWRQVLESPFCIHVLRNPLEVAHSLRTRNGIPIGTGLALWETYNLHMLNASAGLPRVFVHYEDLMKNASVVVEQLHSVLLEQGGYGLRIPSADELSRFLDDGLYRHRKSERSLRSVATAHQLKLYDGFRGDPDTLQDSLPDLSRSAIDKLRRYEKTIDVEDRIARARLARQRRVPEGEATRLKLRDLELEHARSSLAEVSERLAAAEQETRQLRRAEIEARSAITRSVQQAEHLASELDNARKTATSLEDERSTLRSTNFDLEKDRAVLQEAKANLEENASSLRHELSVLGRAKAQLEAAQVDAKEMNAALREDLAARARDSEALADANAALREDLAARARDSEALADANAALREDLAARASDSDALAAANAALREDLAARARDSEALANAHAGLCEDLASRRRECDALSDAIATLREDLEAQIRASEGLERANAVLQEESEQLTRERDLLERSSAELELARSSLEQSNAALNRETDDLRLERTLLENANAQLEEKGASIEQARVSAEKDHAALAAKLHRASEEVAGRQSLVRDLAARWDRELSDRKDQASALSLLASAMHSDIAGLLNSRRWRLGRAIVSALCVLSFRRVPNDLGEQLRLESARFRAKEQLIGEFATSRDDIPSKLAELAPTTATSVDEVLDRPARRPAEMTVRLLERALELKRRAQQVDELSAHVDSLVTIFEGIMGSWRWRLGNCVVSAARRLVRGKVPATAADSAAALVARYRSGSYADVATCPVIPMPDDPKEAPSGDLAGRVSSKTQTIRAGTSDRRRAVRPSLPARRVDIVVCVHNALEDVRRCLESVLSRTAIDFALIVVNDGSGPETTKWLRDTAGRHSVIELIETDGPLGYTRAANRGLRATTAPYVALLNSDTVVPRLWVECLLECLQTDERLGIVGPLSNAASWQSVPERFADSGGWAINDLPVGYNVDEYGELVHRISEQAFPRVEFLNGFCLLMRRKVVKAIGYLDEDAFPQGYGEENDYCIRAREAGFELAIADHCFVYHAKSRSFGTRARDRLAEEGRKALWRKHGKKQIEEGTADLKESPALAGIRSRLSSFFAPSPRLAIGSPSWQAPGVRHDAMRVLFVLPVRGGSGGANSVVQEVAGMRCLGVDARVAVDARHAESMSRFYADVLEPASRIVFASDAELLSTAEHFDVIVATLWSTPALIAPVAARWPEKAYVYYVQDYEPWFFPNDPVARATALDSYTRVPNMVLMAKTDWICRTVRERHGVAVFRVAPSLDHDVFYVTDRPCGGPITLSAMIRPTTPRRAPLRTLRVLRNLAHGFDALRILLFGCESDALDDLVRSDAELNLDFDFENRGILTRRDVAGLLRQSDIFIDLSDYQAFGRSGLEAMACGCATVLPARGGTDEYVVDGENAFLVDTTSFEEMTSTIARLIEDRSLREMVRERSLATAASYSIMRASLSELAVFRWAWTVRGNTGFHGDIHGRGIEPPSTVRGS